MTNASLLPTEIGKLTPVDVGAVPNVFMGTVVVEMYCPVTYIFPAESTLILRPISVPVPLIVEYPTAAADLPEKLAPSKHVEPAVPPTSGKRSVLIRLVVPAVIPNSAKI
jgi:hypothetical protein